MTLNIPELEGEIEKALAHRKATFTLETEDMKELVRLAKLGQEKKTTTEQNYAYGEG